jgi:hypothetical protein
MIVAVCIYNRFENLQTWVRCWKACNTEGAQLVIIHNYYGEVALRKRFEDYCNQHEVTYIPRNAQGFDIGAFQDVCRNRLTGFPYYDNLIWCCDDTIPMAKDFIQQFQKSMLPGVGISCMQISKSSPGGIVHVRTTGFCITRAVTLQLTFPADPVITKQHCYLFEHRAGDKTLTNQVRKMGLSCVQVAPNSESPLWDIGYWKRLDRAAEHERVFPSGIKKNDKVVFIVPIFQMYPQIISSLLCQTHKNWELILIYNGPCDNNLADIVKQADDSRIKFIEYPEATGKWGHVLRQWALKEIGEGRLSDADYVVINNADNYLVPVYTERLLKGFDKSHTAVATYCSAMVHNYKSWDVIPCSLKLGFIDCGGVMVKKDVACEVGWRDTGSHSSDWTYFSDIATRYSPSNFVSVPGCLFVHN